MRQLRITSDNFTIDNPILKILFADIKKYDILTPDEEFEIAKKAYNGDINAINKLVNHNMRFVVSVAKQYGNSTNLLDLINVGTIGLLTASKRFDPYKGFKFITYAVFYIRNEILKELSKKELIPLPINLQRDFKKFNKIVTTNLHKLNREITLFDLLENIEMTEFFTEKKIKELYNLYNLSFSIKSYDAEITENFKLLDTFKSNDNADKLVNDDDFKNIISKYLNKLNYVEKYIIEKYYGIGCLPKLFKDIAKDLEVSKTTVMYNHKKALERLKRKMVKYNDFDI